MNFFKEQQIARERLVRFKILFFSTLILANYLFSYIAFIIIYPKIDYVMDDVFIHFFDNHLDHASFWMSFIWFTLLAIGCAQERVRRIALGGGQYVAERVGGKEIPLGTINIKQLRLKNIVEEMSIASGIIPPKIYILENENEINAFAAGFTINDAVIGISNGCLEKLTREELQGVIAHEIGHIVNGDMKLNLELIAYLKEFFPNLKQLKKDADEINIFFKCFYLLIGSPIVFLWKLAYFLQVMLKQAVTRNQEFIADAKAVQLTRNPDGIAGALKKILVRGNSFSVASDNAQEFFHLWLHWPQSRIFSSHPPLEERIAKILPGFDHSQFVLKEKRSLQLIMEGDFSDEITKSFSDSSNITNEILTEINTSKEEIERRVYKFFETVSSHFETSTNINTNFVKEMDVLLSEMRSLDQETILKLLNSFKEIIAADKNIIPREILCFILFKETLLTRKKGSSQEIGLHKARNDVFIVLSFLAQISSLNKVDREDCFKRSIQLIYGNLQTEMPLKFKTNDLIKALEVCQSLVPLAKEKLLMTSISIIEQQKDSSFDKEVFKKVLAQFMGVPINAIYS